MRGKFSRLCKNLMKIKCISDNTHRMDDMSAIPDFVSRVEIVRQRLLRLAYEERKQSIPRYYVLSGLVDSTYQKRWLSRDKKIQEGIIADVNTLMTVAFSNKTAEEKAKALEALERVADKEDFRNMVFIGFLILSPVLIVAFTILLEYLRL